MNQKFPKAKSRRRCAQSLESELQLRVSGQNVWVGTPGKLTHYDWDTGKVLQEIPLAGRTEFIARNDEFLIVGAGANGQALVTHINPATGESRVEQIGQPGQTGGRAKCARSDGKRRRSAERRPSVDAGKARSR